MVSTFIQMGHDMKEIGWKIYNMELEKNSGLTIRNMKVHIDLEKSKGMVLTDGLMDPLTLECGTITN